jgi:hypothetical protein
VTVSFLPVPSEETPEMMQRLPHHSMKPMQPQLLMENLLKKRDLQRHCLVLVLAIQYRVLAIAACQHRLTRSACNLGSQAVCLLAELVSLQAPLPGRRCCLPGRLAC